MRRALPWLAGLLMVLMTVAAWAVPLLEGAERRLPPVVEDTTKPRECTIAFLVDDTATNDVLAVRMEVDATENTKPVNGRMPCPRSVPPRVGVRALDACRSRAAEPRTCVFADMSRGFEQEPDARNTAENASRCASDQATHIGIACWRAGRLEVCNVGCGESEAAAAAQARERCQSKHEQPCVSIGAIPVLRPQ